MYSAAGTLVEFGFVDVRTKTYHAVSRHDLVGVEGRVSCFVASINIFRLLRTMAPHIPSNPSPVFQEQRGLMFFDKYVIKKLPQYCTCPPQLYALLATGSVPCAAKVEQRGASVKVSPVGVRTPPSGRKLALEAAVRDCLCCLKHLHARGFVHRDIRWPNLIRIFQARAARLPV